MGVWCACERKVLSVAIVEWQVGGFVWVVWAGFVLLGRLDVQEEVTVTPAIHLIIIDP